MNKRYPFGTTKASHQVIKYFCHYCGSEARSYYYTLRSCGHSICWLCYRDLSKDAENKQRCPICDDVLYAIDKFEVSDHMITYEDRIDLTAQDDTTVEDDDTD